MVTRSAMPKPLPQDLFYQAGIILKLAALRSFSVSFTYNAPVLHKTLGGLVFTIALN